MKRKIFSKLLMVALVIAAVGSFVSCKDYDDDINNLQKQIDAKAAISQIESLQSQLTAAQSAAQKAQTDATKALADAAAAAKTAGDAATAKALEDAIAKVNAAAEKAATENAAAIKAAADAAAAAGTDAKAAADAAAEAKTAAEKAYTDALEAIKAEIAKIKIPDVSGFLTEAQIKNLISQNAQAKGEYVTATSLATQLDELKKTIPGAVDLTEINNAIASYDTAISALYSAVTSVELISSYNGTPWNVFGKDLAYNYNGLRHLTMLHGFVGDNSIFGDETDCGTVANPFEYVKDADIKSPSGLVVRVNPVNADLTKSEILLINSLGEGLDDYVVTGTPYRYTGLVTRGTNVNTGLWVIPFTVKDGISADDLLAKTRTFDANGDPDKYILHALAIKNTGDDAADRYVVSTYDIAPSYEAYSPAHDFYFTVEDKSVVDIRNRWEIDNAPNGNNIVAEQKSKAVDYDKYLYPELRWTTIKVGNNWIWDPQPAFTYDRDNNGNFTNKRLAWANNDQRSRISGYSLLPVKVDVPFTVANVYQEGVDPMDPQFNYGYNKIEYYYVALDCHNAIESSPSEINAWESYNYDGLYTRVSADESLQITIHDGAKSVATGDVIGFRVYAVNYDGTLADPDGKAFYVYVGDDKSTADLGAATITATDTLTIAGGKTAKNVLQSTSIDVTGLINGDYWYSIQTAANNKGVIAENANTTLTGDIVNYFKFIFYDKDGKVLGSIRNGNWWFNGSDYSKATKLQITANIDTDHNIYNLIDNGIYSFVIYGGESLDDQADFINRQTLNFTVQKLLPTEVVLPEFRTSQSADGKSFISYMVPDSMGVTESKASYYWNKINYWNTADANNKFFHSYVTGIKNPNKADYFASYTAKGVAGKNVAGRISGFKDLNNVFYNLNEDTLYQFKFAKSMTDSIKNIGDKVTHNNPIYVSTWDENHPLVTVAGVNPPFLGAGYAQSGNYKSYNTRYVLAVPRRYIDGKTSHSIDVSHKYLGVSTTLNEDGDVDNFAETHLATTESAFTVTYASWIQASTFSNVAKPTLQWMTTPEKADTLKFANIKSTNTYNGELFSKNLSALINAEYLMPVVTKIQFKSANGHVNEYFQPEPANLGTASQAAGSPALPLFKLEQKDGRGEKGDIVLCVTQVSTQLDANPITDHDEDLEITVVDAFGIEHKISVPVLIKRAQN